MITIVVTIGILYVYFFPGILALILHHVDWKGVLWTNLLIGWTIVGWFILLVWALDTERKA
jgi:hypothetical protein